MQVISKRLNILFDSVNLKKNLSLYIYKETLIKNRYSPKILIFYQIF